MTARRDRAKGPNVQMNRQTSTPTSNRAALIGPLHPRDPGAPFVEWIISNQHIPYPAAMAAMEARVAAIAAGQAREAVWLLEHPPLYTAGTSARREDLIDPRFPVFDAGRGGQYTYHGPGQRVAYVMLDLKRRTQDLRRFVAGLETWLIATLAAFNVTAERREDRVGVWVRHANGEDKIAAIGIRVRQGVTFHGISLNVDPDLAHFGGIIPCGVREHGVTSLTALGLPVTLHDVDAVLKVAFEEIFGPTGPGAPLTDPSPDPDGA